MLHKRHEEELANAKKIKEDANAAHEKKKLNIEKLSPLFMDSEIRAQSATIKSLSSIKDDLGIDQNENLFVWLDRINGDEKIYDINSVLIQDKLKHVKLGNCTHLDPTVLLEFRNYIYVAYKKIADLKNNPPSDNDNRAKIHLYKLFKRNCYNNEDQLDEKKYVNAFTNDRGYGGRLALSLLFYVTTMKGKDSKSLKKLDYDYTSVMNEIKIKDPLYYACLSKLMEYATSDCLVHDFTDIPTNNAQLYTVFENNNGNLPVPKIELGDDNLQILAKDSPNLIDIRKYKISEIDGIIRENDVKYENNIQVIKNKHLVDEKALELRFVAIEMSNENLQNILTNNEDKRHENIPNNNRQNINQGNSLLNNPKRAEPEIAEVLNQNIAVIQEYNFIKNENEEVEYNTDFIIESKFNLVIDDNKIEEYNKTALSVDTHFNKPAQIHPDKKANVGGYVTVEAYFEGYQGSNFFQNDVPRVLRNGTVDTENNKTHKIGAIVEQRGDGNCYWRSTGCGALVFGQKDNLYQLIHDYDPEKIIYTFDNLGTPIDRNNLLPMVDMQYYAFKLLNYALHEKTEEAQDFIQDSANKDYRFIYSLNLYQRAFAGIYLNKFKEKSFNELPISVAMVTDIETIVGLIKEKDPQRAKNKSDQDLSSEVTIDDYIKYIVLTDGVDAQGPLLYYTMNALWKVSRIFIVNVDSTKEIQKTPDKCINIQCMKYDENETDEKRCPGGFATINQGPRFRHYTREVDKNISTIYVLRKEGHYSLAFSEEQVQNLKAKGVKPLNQHAPLRDINDNNDFNVQQFQQDKQEISNEELKNIFNSKDRNDLCRKLEIDNKSDDNTLCKTLYKKFPYEISFLFEINDENYTTIIDEIRVLGGPNYSSYFPKFGLTSADFTNFHNKVFKNAKVVAKGNSNVSSSKQINSQASIDAASKFKQLKNCKTHGELAKMLNCVDKVDPLKVAIFELFMQACPNNNHCLNFRDIMSAAYGNTNHFIKPENWHKNRDLVGFTDQGMKDLANMIAKAPRD